MALSGQLARNLQGVIDLLGKRGTANVDIAPSIGHNMGPSIQPSVKATGPWRGTAPGQAERPTTTTIPERMTDPKTATDQDLHDLVRMLFSQEEKGAMGPQGQLTQPILEEAKVLRSQKERARGAPRDVEDFLDPSKSGSAEDAILGYIPEKGLWREGKVEDISLSPDEIVQKNKILFEEANKVRVAQGKKPWNREEINSVIASSPLYRRQLANEAGVPLDLVRDIDIDEIDEFAKATAKGNQRQIEKIIRGAGKDPAGDPAKDIQLGRGTLYDALFDQPRRIEGLAPMGTMGGAGEAALMRGTYGGFRRPEKVASNIERQSVDPHRALAEIMQGRPGAGPLIAQGIDAGVGPKGMFLDTGHTGFGRRINELEFQNRLNKLGAEPEDVNVGQNVGNQPQDTSAVMPISEQQVIGKVGTDDLRATPTSKLSEIDFEGEISRRKIDDIAEEIQGQRLNAPHRMVESAKEQVQPVVDREANFELVARVRESLDQLRADIGEGRSFVRSKPGVGKAEFGGVAGGVGRGRSKKYKNPLPESKSVLIKEQQQLRAMVDDAESALERANEIGNPALTRQLGSAIASGNRESIKKAIAAIPGHEPSGGTVFGGPAPALKGRAAVQKYETEIFKLDKQLDQLRERARMLPKDSKARAAINAEGIRIKRQKADLEGAAKEVEGAITPSRQTRFERKQGAKVAENLRRSAVETEGSESLKAKYGDQPDDVGFEGSIDDAIEEGATFGGSYEMPDVELAGPKAAIPGEPVNPKLLETLTKRATASKSRTTDKPIRTHGTTKEGESGVYQYASTPETTMGKRSPLANILDGKEIEVVERLGVADDIAALFRSKGIKGDVSREQFVELLDQVLAQ